MNIYELYRHNRPWKFSDSKVVRKAELTKEVFQYQMDRLSNDMKQDQFENLTRSLALRFVTPNLIPQTGPTGGGDGKTDLETHPVADEITEKWYVADGGCRGSEKWAVAISCREDWDIKVKNDVANIVKLNRGFTRILFFSNRLIKSRDSKGCEDDLKNKYGIPVTIFSQNWFVDRVFKDNCVNIAVKELGLSDNYVETKEVGPNDLQRQQRLDEVEDIVLKRELGDGFDTEFIDLLLESAILSRELELAPSIVRGRFVRAEESCKHYGTVPQLYEIIYQQGWTEFYWLENPLGTMGFLLKLKPLLEEEVNVSRIEKYIALFYAMTNAQTSGLFDDEESLKKEIEYQNELLQKLENDSCHQSSYLYLKFSLLEQQLIYGSREEDDINQVLSQMTSVLQEATNHIDIPFESLCKIVEMAGTIIIHNEVYENLIDILSEILSKREQDIKAAEVQKNRGLQNLEKGDTIQAIRHIGQCVDLFSKESTKKDYVVACSYLGMAFMYQDLLYAAKVMFVKSAAMLLHNVELNGNPDHLTITILSQLCEVGLRSGRILDFLLSLELRDIIVRFNPDFEEESFWKHRSEEEAALAVRMLACGVDDEVYGKLPAIFERMELQSPKDVLLFCLGYKDLVSKEFEEVVKTDDNWTETLRKQSEDDFFLFANAIADKETKLETVVKGCRIFVNFKSDCQLQVCAELLLAFLESLFATATFKDFIFTTQNIYFKLQKVSEGSTEIIPEGHKDKYVFLVNANTIGEKEAWQAFSLFLGQLFTRNALAPDMVKMFDDKQTKEKIMNRLSAMMTYKNDVRILYGDDYKNTLSKWVNPSDAFYTFKGNDNLSTPFEKNRGKQADITIKSIINNPLWDKALWSGCGYLLARDYSEPPIMMLLFKDMEAGKMIFEEWRLLHEKGCLNMRLSLIQHVDKDNPTWYKVIVGQDINDIRNENVGRYVLQTERFVTMKPRTNENIDVFKVLYRKFGFCKLSSVRIDDNQQMVLDDPQQRCPFLLPVKNIVFREAWEIGVNDQDSSAILPDDNPIIPTKNKIDAPVIELLKRKRQKAT
jgi:hypothetical protein